LWWQGNIEGVYKVNVAYHQLNQSNYQILNWLWKVKIPYKVSCLIWLLARGVVLTLDNLMKRGIHMCSRCFLCKEIVETVIHLFLFASSQAGYGALF
ncbi:hypothetical protein MTR67_023730, partial [Solanum verrucosum]